MTCLRAVSSWPSRGMTLGVLGLVLGPCTISTSVWAKTGHSASALMVFFKPKLLPAPAQTLFLGVSQEWSVVTSQRAWSQHIHPPHLGVWQEPSSQGGVPFPFHYLLRAGGYGTSRTALRGLTTSLAVELVPKGIPGSRAPPGLVHTTPCFLSLAKPSETSSLSLLCGRIGALSREQFRGPSSSALGRVICLQSHTSAMAASLCPLHSPIQP